MIDEKVKKGILAKNKKIENAILVSQMMDHKGYEVMKKDLDRMLKDIRFQDIFGIKDDALKDQKGIAMGIIQVINYFDDIKKLALQPRTNPETGEKEVLNANKKEK